MHIEPKWRRMVTSDPSQPRAGPTGYTQVEGTPGTAVIPRPRHTREGSLNFRWVLLRNMEPYSGGHDHKIDI